MSTNNLTPTTVHLNVGVETFSGALASGMDMDSSCRIDRSPTVKSREFYLHDDVIDVLHVLDFCCVEFGVS